MAKTQPEVVVITGASAGVGRAVVREFARRNAWIGLMARDPQRLEATKTEVEQLGGRALVLPGDIADAAHVEAAADHVESSFGPIDVWVNNAMTTIFAPLQAIEPDEFKRATEVTYLGCVYGTMSALRRMRKRDRGTIVQVGSALSYRSIPLQSPYCGAKHALVGFTDSLRSELIHDRSKIHITVVHLPALNTPQFSWCRSRLPRQPQPVPPIYDPELAAEAIYYAAHHRRREIFRWRPNCNSRVWTKGRTRVGRLVSWPHRLPDATNSSTPRARTPGQLVPPGFWILRSPWRLYSKDQELQHPELDEFTACAAGCCGPVDSGRRASVAQTFAVNTGMLGIVLQQSRRPRSQFHVFGLR